MLVVALRMSHIKQLLRVCINLLSALTVPFFHLLLGDLQFIRLSGGHPVYGPPKSSAFVIQFRWDIIHPVLSFRLYW